MLIRQIPGYFSWKNSDSVTLGMNLNLSKVLGYSHPLDAIGKTEYELPCPASEHAEVFISQDRKVMSSKQTLKFYELITYVDNTHKLLFTEKSPLFNDNKNVAGVICHSVDMTETLLLKLFNTISSIKPSNITNVSFEIKEYFEETSIFTERESEVFFYFLRGKTCKQIGEILNLSPRTVETHIAHIKDKVGCRTKSELIDKAISLGLIQVIPKNLLNKYI